MKTCYIPRRFSDSSLEIIAQAETICRTYAGAGRSLTLRQLFYRFVAGDLIANKQSEYKRLGSIVNDARLAGLIDWDHMIDRTRDLKRLPNWSDPASIMRGAARGYHRDLWATQPTYVEVWVEKDALVGIVAESCDPLDVPYFSCRGNTSQSEMWAAAMRMVQVVRSGRNVVVLHLGDHDPSGVDMTRDIRDRLTMYLEHHVSIWSDDGDSAIAVNRIALTREQIDQYNPPPNPAKTTDARYAAYARIHGDESWELDALEPTVLSDLIRDNVLALRDDDAWDAAVDRQERERSQLTAVADRWSDVRGFIAGD